MDLARTVRRLVPLGIRERRTMRRLAARGERELALLPTLLDRPGIAVDIGANIGVYSYALARLGRRVVAFEPNPSAARRVRAVLGRRGTVHEVALSNAAGTAVFHVPWADDREVHTRGSLEAGMDPELTTRPIDVRIETLDSFGLRDVAFVKLDVEGHEHEALQGATETLAASRPTVLAEIEDSRRAGTFDRCRALLEDLGYEGFWLDQHGELTSVDAFDIAVHQSEEHRPRWGEPSRGHYVHNFIWRPRPH